MLEGACDGENSGDDNGESDGADIDENGDADGGRQSSDEGDLGEGDGENELLLFTLLPLDGFEKSTACSSLRLASSPNLAVFLTWQKYCEHGVYSQKNIC